MTETLRNPASGDGPRGRWPLQLEDLALFLYLALGEPMIARFLAARGGTVDPWDLEPGTAAGRSAALALFVAAAGAALCLVTRRRGEASASGRLRIDSLASYARFPTMVLVAFFLAQGLEGYGVVTSDGFFFGVIILLALPMAFSARLPRLPTVARRLLMTPAILIGTTAFIAMTGKMVPDRMELAVLRNPDDPLFGFAVFITSLLLLGAAAFYNFFIVSPRVVAGAGGGVLWWSLRFVVFVAGLVLGVALPI